MSYKKGANAERELISMLEAKGFATLRAAGSAKHKAPDCIAIKGGFAIAFECKAINKNILSIKAEQMNQLEEWSSRASVPFFIAWRLPGKKWLFLAKNDFNFSGKYYSITLKDAIKKASTFEIIIKEQTKLKLPKRKIA